MDFQMFGPALALGLSHLGSAIGCGIAGMASHGAMSRTEDGHGKMIALSAFPSSQAIYGLILTILMVSAPISDWSKFGVGLLGGLAIMGSAIYQGRCAASAIQAISKKPDVFGKCVAALGIVESFALFAFVFSLVFLLSPPEKKNEGGGNDTNPPETARIERTVSEMS